MLTKTKRYIIKTVNSDGIPSRWEITDFEAKHGVCLNNVPRLYVTFKVNKRRKIKRLRIDLKIYPCDLCGSHAYMMGKVGSKEFDKGQVY